MTAEELRLKALQIATERNPHTDDYSHGTTWLDGVAVGLAMAKASAVTVGVRGARMVPVRLIEIDLAAVEEARKP